MQFSEGLPRLREAGRQGRLQLKSGKSQRKRVALIGEMSQVGAVVHPTNDAPALHHASFTCHMKSVLR